MVREGAKTTGNKLQAFRDTFTFLGALEGGIGGKVKNTMLGYSLILGAIL